eukprot:7348088-Prymnesium_polylepis.1
MAAGDWGQATIAALAARLMPARNATVSYLCKHAGWTQLHFLLPTPAVVPPPVTPKRLACGASARVRLTCSTVHTTW